MADEGNSVELSLEEMEAAAASEVVKPNVLDGDGVPAEFKGKSAQEVSEMLTRTQTALRISEESRLKALEDAARRPAAAVVVPPAPPEVKEMTQDEFDALYETNPREALRLWGEQREEILTRNIMARVAPLAAGAANSAEQFAKERFKDEFAIFAADIEQIKKTIPNPGFLASSEGWEQVISFVRGKPGNFERLIEHKTKGNNDAAAAAARAAEVASAGATPRSTVTPISAGASDPSHFNLDETERRVAAELKMSNQEYAKWKGMK